MTFELEMKQMRRLGETDVVISCDFCDDQAYEVVEIGDSDYSSGTEFWLCKSPYCEESAFEQVADSYEALKAG